MLASRLDYVVYTVGILAALRSKYLNGASVGVMITASHNPPPDNGIKMVDPTGDMLEQSWEKYATELANASHTELPQTVADLVKTLSIDLSIPASVVIARDSRDSGPALLQSTKDGISVFSGEIADFGLLTTPQLHYLTRCFNDKAFGTPTEQGYFEKVAASYQAIYQLYGFTSKRAITIDAANGIGGPKITDSLASLLANEIEFTVVNNEFTTPEALNFSCGADFVKTGQKLPANVQPSPNTLYASFDGDADRVVCYYVNGIGQFRLLDGDKIATLLAKFMQETLAQTSLDITIGVVQTAYANGSSTDYATQKLSLPMACTATGVKHLHHAAKEFDIGIYFEANGHGTVLYSPETIEKLTLFASQNAEETKLVLTLLHLSDLINQTVGDAIGDLLAIVILCQIMDKSPEQWDNEYTDLPNALDKLLVSDRSLFTTTDAERKLVTPAGLQGKIEAVYTKYPRGRSFVRASGTEDAVRVYVEAEKAGDVASIMEEVKKAVLEASK
ncbi:hypothetical protein BABINDRAFT_163640 [Babjeviella inositovora NRRL Y-12698]|uniref:Phosphoacetylglucosamine mutase n=1 Tax=Babjeviella inositovora NRRL Y-12698 TaxID=984486 RepID=A0A1E3QIW5_9ASCO|nr:uncharacterized protein BABINDRAFT_163640 [Babjeviella inositovora NRRL Y-12698]ODQ77394.1 hypothetical protein BABINDRAFT_163640 [Babjeviella inositovora NRRL Y-12698]